MATHVESFGYSDWRINRSGNNVSSAGSASKSSSLYPLNKVIGDIALSATGGFGWCSAYNEDYEERGDSLYCNLTVTAYLVKEDNTRYALPGATGSAYKSGYLDCYSHATTGTRSITITDAQRAEYKYLQIVYSCSTSKSSAHVDQTGSFNNGGTGNPVGSATFTYRDDINVQLDGTTMTDLFFKDRGASSFAEMRGLEFDGTQIF